MAAFRLADVLEDTINYSLFDFITVNFANPDMIAHTGNLEATIKGCEAVDQSLGLLYHAMQKKSGTMIITADHGNAEELINLETGEIDTKHSSNKVPFMVVNHYITKKNLKLRKDGKLGDIAPTILELLEIKKPNEMTGKSLIN
jgi:2,3-bisphosphoglycerate-independent phosphoglycerate mutase